MINTLESIRSGYAVGKKRKLYLFGSPEHNWYKLGVSYNPESRRKLFQDVLPFPVVMLATVRFTYLDGFRAFQAEKELQDLYAPLRQRGEWFRDLDVKVVADQMKRLAKEAA